MDRVACWVYIDTASRAYGIANRGRLPADHAEAMHLFEMLVTADDRLVVLASQRRDPYVILGNRATASAQLVAYFGTVLGRSLVDPQKDGLPDQAIEQHPEMTMMP